MQQYDAYSFELMPPTPKTTPLFMTPPVTPPNESWIQQQMLQDGNGSKPIVIGQKVGIIYFKLISKF